MVRSSPSCLHHRVLVRARHRCFWAREEVLVAREVLVPVPVEALEVPEALVLVPVEDRVRSKSFLPRA